MSRPHPVRSLRARPTPSRAPAFLLAACSLFLPAAASAVTHTFSILLDLDDNPSTGCTVSTVAGPFDGVEQILDTTVDTTTGPPAATVTALAIRTCTDPLTDTFGPAVPVTMPTAPPWPVGIGNGTGGLNVIETYFPLVSSVVPNPKLIRLGVTSVNDVGAEQALLTQDGTSGGAPIVLDLRSVVEIPTLSEWGLLGLIALLGMAAVALLRRRSAVVLLVVLALFGAAGVAWAACVLDGQTGDWSGGDQLATDGMVLFGKQDGQLLCFRIDSTLTFIQPQTISFTSAAPAAAMVAGPTYTVTATATSSLPVALTIDPSASAVCSISGSTVSFIGAGTCVIDANQAGNASYSPAPQVQQSFAVGKGDQTISFTSTAPAAATVGGPTYSVTATASPSGLPVTFAIDAAATSVCSIAGSTVSFIGVGTCVINANQAGDANWNAAPQVQQSFAVAKGDQTISFTSTAPAAAMVGGATYTVTATATSGLAVAFTIDAAATSVCSIAGSTVSFLTIGTCVIDADQPGDANWNAAPQVQQSFAVGKGDQTISFTSTAPAAAQVGGATYTVTATATSSLTVAFTIDAVATSVCSIAGSTVSFLTIGTCVIDANQPGDANWNAAPQVQQSFAVGKGDQTISFTSTAPAAAQVGGATYTVTATATSSLPVAFTIDAVATSVCSIAGPTVSFLTVGTCVIDANQAGDANWNAAPQVQQSFAVGKGDQTISFTSTAPAAATVSGPTYTVTATASPSGLPVAFTIDAVATSVCSIAGSTVSFLGVGTCVIDANQAGDANWNAAPQVQQSFGVGKGDQTISYTSTAPAAAMVGGPTYTVTATASPSGLPVAFTIDAVATSVCSIAGSTVSFIGVGTCVIDANQAGDANYNAAPQVQQSFAVAKGDQTISFTSPAPAAAMVGGPTYTVTATASPSGLPVAFTIDAAATSVCSIAGSTVSFIGVGTCVIDANQAGDANYNAAPQAQQSFAVAKGDQTISFTSPAPAAAKVGGPTYTVTATASPSGLPVAFTIDAVATSVCSIAGSTVSFLTVGTCVIDADQAGDANYNAAPQAQQSFAVAKGDQTISFTSTAPAAATVGGATYTVTATASPSGLPVAFTIDAVATSVCSIAGSTVSFIGTGTCVIDANQAGDANYNAAPQAQQSFAVGKGDQTISFTSTAPTDAKVGGPTYTVTATATSGLAVAFTIDASATSVCSIAGSTVSFIGSGICVIDANQPGDANYNAAPQAQQSFSVYQAPAITSANATSFTSTVFGTFTVTTTGFPTGASMAISESGALPTGVGFVDNNDGTATLSGTPAAGTQGTWPITITANNGVAPNAMQSFTLTVLNNPPMLATNPVAYTTPGNTQLQVAGAMLAGVAAWTDASGLLAKSGATDTDGPGPLSVVPASGTATNGGSYSIFADGSFTFVPAAGFSGMDSFNYQVTDTMTATTGTVNVSVGQRVWYLRDVVDANNPAGGDGRSTNAFDTIAAFNAATTNNGDIIFIFRGNTGATPLAGGITLKDGQKLWGQGIGLTVPGFGTLVAAGSKPKINNTGGDAVSVPATAGNRQNVEIRGLDLQGSGNAVDVTASGANNVSVTISDNDVSGAGLEGYDLNAGSTGTFAATLSNNAIGATGTAFDARTSAATTMTIDFSDNAVVAGGTGILIDGSVGGGTTTITGFANNAVDGATAGTGISVTSAKFDATPGGSYQPVSGGMTLVGASGDHVGGAGVLLGTVSGDLAFTDLDVFTDGGAGLRITGTAAVNVGAGTGTRVTVVAGVATINAIGGPAVDVTSATVDLQLAGMTTSGSGSTGVSLVGVADGTTAATFSAPSGSTIATATGTAFNLDGGNATVTYNGTINNSAGHAVEVKNRTADTATFTGGITETGTGILVNANNVASTTNFQGGLSVSTGANPAFTATSGGTLNVCDDDPCNPGATGAKVNTLTTTTGTALNVTSTTIGANNLEFRSITAGTAASGPASGIVLNNTGASGGLKVKGTGGAATGGTIQKTTGDGVSLTNTLSPSLTNLTIKDTAGDGVGGTQVTNFTFVNGSIDNSGTGLGAEAANIGFNNQAAGTENNLSGTVTITGNSLTNAYYHGIDIFNFNGTIADANLSTNTITSSNSTATSKGSGIRLVAFGSATTVANVTKATIANNIISNFPSANGILASGGNGNAAGPAGVFGTAGSGVNVIAITGNRVAGFSAAVKIGAFAIAATVNGKGQGNFDISNNGTVANPITNVIGQAITNSSLGFANRHHDDQQQRHRCQQSSGFTRHRRRHQPDLRSQRYSEPYGHDFEQQRVADRRQRHSGDGAGRHRDGPGEDPEQHGGSATLRQPKWHPRGRRQLGERERHRLPEHLRQYDGRRWSVP